MGIENVMDKVDHVLVMTVNPGFGGQNYIPTMLEKIKKIRKWAVDGGFDIDIEVDGGVKADWTIAQCADAGADCFIAGSGMFKYDDLSVGCSELRQIATAAQKGKIMPPGRVLRTCGVLQVLISVGDYRRAWEWFGLYRGVLGRAHPVGGGYFETRSRDGSSSSTGICTVSIRVDPVG